MKNPKLFAPVSLIAAVGLIAVASSFSAQARAFDAAEAEVYAVPLPDSAPAKKAPGAATGLSRADVMAELVRARAAGELDFASIDVHGFPLAPRGRVEASPLQIARGARR